MTHKIGWLNRPGTTGETWNPVTGCTKISAGCKNCYAERMSKRLKGRFGYPEDDPFKVTLHPDKLEEPLRWKKPRTVFVCSMGDLFHKRVPTGYIQQVFDLMSQTPQHTYLILTKRPHRMKMFFVNNTDVNGYLHTWNGRKVKRPLPNVWGLVTAENQKQADLRIPLLLQSPFAVRGVSIEPMLEAVDLDYPCLAYHSLGLTDTADIMREYGEQFWVIAGAETGPGARTMQLSDAYNVKRQCERAGVPFFFKSAGKNIAIPADLMVREWPGGAE